MAVMNATPAPEDFSYLPSWHQHQIRKLALLTSSKCGSEGNPIGFPPQLDTPLAWKSTDMQRNAGSWTLYLTEEDICSIDFALHKFEESDLPFQSIRRSTFPLPISLEERLAEAVEDVHERHGFVLIKGLNPFRYSSRQKVIVHAGLTSYFGETRGYNGFRGTDVLAHIRDLQAFYPQANIATPGFTNKAMTMHTDLADIVSLFTLSRGGKGGSFRIASGQTVYNRLASTQPAVVKTLSEHFVFDAFICFMYWLDNLLSDVAPNRSLHPDLKPYSKPLLHFHNNRILLQSFRRPFTGFGGHKRSPLLPVMTRRQMIALDELYFVALANSITIDFEPGDLFLFNNLAMLHSRDAYEIDENGGERHLMKIFVRNDFLGWEIPPILKDQWDLLYGDRGIPRVETLPEEPYTGQNQHAQGSLKKQTTDWDSANGPPITGWAQNG